MKPNTVTIVIDGEAVEYRGRSVAEALGGVVLADLRHRAERAKANTLLTPGMELAMGHGQADGYAWVGLRAYELIALLNAAAMLDAQLETP